jgi:hypothetical protein
MSMQTAINSPEQDNELSLVRREQLQWICQNELRRRPISKLESSVILPIASVALNSTEALDILASLVTLVDSFSADDLIDSIDPDISNTSNTSDVETIFPLVTGSNSFMV